MKQDPIEMAERQMLWERNCGDGLAFISNGLMLWLIIIAVSQSFFWYLACLPVALIHHIIRKRYVIPRTGQARLRYKPRELIIVVVWGTGTALVLSLGGMWMTTLPYATPWASLWIGLCIAFLASSWMWMNYKGWDGKSSYLIWQRIIILVALVSLFWLEPNQLTLILLLGTYGLFNLIYGLVTFIRFIRQNPVLPNE